MVKITVDGYEFYDDYYDSSDDFFNWFNNMSGDMIWCRAKTKDGADSIFNIKNAKIIIVEEYCNE